MKTKENKAITLIALVVIIILLLILGGTSISMLTGQNGILNRAEEAKEKTENASKEEQRDLSRLEANTNLGNTKYKGVTIPAGFAPTKIDGEDSVEDGLVITDSDGNEFVWVPCTLDGANNSIKYEKEIGLNTTWVSKYGSYSSGYGGGTWADDGGNSESVAKYGGFYIARYEAGLPKDNSLWKYQDGAAYVRNRNVETMIPVSKKNNAVWNFVSQETATKVSSKMYQNSKSVTSSIVDGHAWDAMVEWIALKSNQRDSTTYGNYVNSNIQLKEALYAINEYDYTQWTFTLRPDKYLLGKLNINERNQSGTQNVYELATGASEQTKVNNIYDVAGNMWEWTSEKGHTSYNVNREAAIVRGGSFVDRRNGWTNML